MAQVVIEIPVDIEQIGLKVGPMRRSSTGNSVIQIREPTAIPRCSRASLGSCHDICKYGMKRELETQQKAPFTPRKCASVVTEQKEKSGKNLSGKKLPTVSSRQKANELIWKPAGKNMPSLSAAKQTNRNSLTGKDKKIGYSPTVSSSDKNFAIPKSKTTKNIPKKPASQGNRNSIRTSETVNTNIEDVSEKIIHVVEPSVGRQNSTPTRNGRLVEEENDSSPRKLNFKTAKLLDNQNENGKSKDRDLRKVVYGKKQIDKSDDSVDVPLRPQVVKEKKSGPGLLNSVIEETASRLVKVRNSKVKALVGAFQIVINLQDSNKS